MQDGDKQVAFTVAEALEIEVFHECCLLTGQAGLQNEIRWVNILEILDDLSHIEPGEFLITTAHGFNAENRVKQRDMIELFASRKLAAMAIQTGHYLQEIPSSFIRFSENYSIPLIEIPPQVSFKNLTRALLNELMRRELNDTGAEGKASPVRRPENQIKDMKNLWEKLIKHDDHKGLTIQMSRHKIKPKEPILVMALDICDTDGKNIDLNEENNHETLRLFEHAIAQTLRQLQIPYLFGPSEHFIIILIQSEQLKKRNTTADSKIARHLLDKLNNLLPEQTIRVGLSSIHGGIGMIGQAIDEAEKASQAGQLELLDHTNLVSLRSMNLYRLIMDTENTEMLKSIFNETVAPLVEYDQKSNGSLLKTLKVYLRYCSIKKASEVIFVHRHTMKYRLDQIEELTGFNPIYPNDALQLNIGLHIYHYLKASDLLI